jgi:hypothetical protein
MYFAYKHAREKYKERRQLQAQPVGELANGSAQLNQDTAVEARNGEGTNAMKVPTIASGAEIGRAPEAKETPVNNVSKTKKEDEPPYEDLAEKKRRRKYRWKIIFGLLAPFTLQSLDMTIIASALPYIATDFGECSPLSVPCLYPTTPLPVSPGSKTTEG